MEVLPSFSEELQSPETLDEVEEVEDDVVKLADDAPFVQETQAEVVCPKPFVLQRHGLQLRCD